ncbi:MAG: hypothetical protein AAGG01_12470 [Planctomycetota bacterium]
MLSALLAFIVTLAPLFGAPQDAPTAPAIASCAPSLSTEVFHLHGQPDVTLTVRSTGTTGEFTWEIKERDQVVETGDLQHVHGPYYKMSAGSSLGMLIATEYGCSTALVAGENPGHVAHWIRTDR